MDIEKRRQQKRAAQATYRKTEKGIATKKKYKNSPAGKAAKVRWIKKWRQRNSIKHLAHNLVNAAIKAGRLHKGVCEVCGSKTVHGHHEDYFEPLEVRWLCPKHHREIHH